jgi:hypothetical protein
MSIRSVQTGRQIRDHFPVYDGDLDKVPGLGQDDFTILVFKDAAVFDGLDVTITEIDGAAGEYAAAWTFDEPADLYEIEITYSEGRQVYRARFTASSVAAGGGPAEPGARAYCTIADMRAEGVTDAEADDDRLALLIEEATAEIDEWTGWWFDVQERTLTLNGRGTTTLALPAPALELTNVTIFGTEIDPDDVDLVGPSPVPSGSYDEGPAVQIEGGWDAGRRNVVIEGTFGYREADGSDQGRVPRGIRRACMLIVLKRVGKLAEDDAARDAHRVKSMRTKTQSVDFRDPAAGDAPYTGDAEIDQILLRFAKPMGLGSV